MFNQQLKEKIRYLEDRISSLEQGELRALRQLHAQQDDFYRLLKYQGLDCVDGTRHIVALPKTPQER